MPQYEKRDFNIAYILSLGSYRFVLTECGDTLDILRLSQSMTGRYCIEDIAPGYYFPEYYLDNRIMVDWSSYKGRPYMILACIKCPEYAGRVRFTFYDRLGKDTETYEIELPEDRSGGYCMAAFEAEKKDDAIKSPEDVVFLPSAG